MQQETTNRLQVILEQLPGEAQSYPSSHYGTQPTTSHGEFILEQIYGHYYYYYYYYCETYGTHLWHATTNLGRTSCLFPVGIALRDVTCGGVCSTG